MPFLKQVSTRSLKWFPGNLAMPTSLEEVTVTMLIIE